MRYARALLNYHSFFVFLKELWQGWKMFARRVLKYFHKTARFWQLCHRTDSHSRKRRRSGGRKCFKCHFSFLLLQLAPLSRRRLHLEVSSRHSRQKVLRLVLRCPRATSKVTRSEGTSRRLALGISAQIGRGMQSTRKRSKNQSW